MKWLIFKIISFMAVFLFAQGAVLPWAISNSTMPLWADIALITVILMAWLAVIDRLAVHILKLFRKTDEATS